jgi:hypothetical protein
MTSSLPGRWNEEVQALAARLKQVRARLARSSKE